MRIAIEAQRLFREKKHGMDLFALELIRNLQKIDHDNEYVVFVKPDKDDSILKESPNFKIVRLEGGFYPVWEQFALPKAARDHGCRLLHCTSNTAPIHCDIPLMVTLHDIIYLENSYAGMLSGNGTQYQKFGNAYRKAIVPRIVHKSRKITTVSHAEKKRIDDFFNLEGDSGAVTVYNGVGEHFRPVYDAAEFKRTREEYHLPEHYFFFLGNTDPKKNTKGTIKAFSDFIKRTGSDYQLVIADYDLSELNKILDEINDQALIGRIVLSGYIANKNLPAIYSQSRLFLYPSNRESFGIPILEAMACGVPVITSSVSSMPEVAGDAALLVNPSDAEEITNAMIHLAGDQEIRKDLVEKGFIQAAKFSWRTTAENMLEIYREVAKGLT